MLPETIQFHSALRTLVRRLIRDELADCVRCSRCVVTAPPADGRITLRQYGGGSEFTVPHDAALADARPGDCVHLYWYGSLASGRAAP